MSRWDGDPNKIDSMDRDGPSAVYDYTPAGALVLQYEKDDEFTAILRETVPSGNLTMQRRPFAWVIDEDYAEDALKACRLYFDYVDHGDIE